MKMRDFTHKGLKRLYTEATTKGVPPETVDKLRKMFAYLDNMEPKRHPEPPADVPYRHG